jgi:KUP system potassium uptake protein
MDSYFAIKNYSQSDQKAFGLDTAVTVVEHVPFIISPKLNFPLVRKNGYREELH